MDAGAAPGAACRTFGIKRSTLIDLARVGWSAGIKVDQDQIDDILLLIAYEIDWLCGAAENAALSRASAAALDRGADLRHHAL